MQEMWVHFLGQEDSLEKEMASCSSILALEIPLTEKPDGLQSMGLQKSHTRLRDYKEQQPIGQFPRLTPTSLLWNSVEPYATTSHSPHFPLSISKRLLLTQVSYLKIDTTS